MKKTILIFVVLLLSVVSTCVAQRTFVHPGSILTKSDLERIKQHVEAREEPWYSSWQSLQASSYGNCSRTPNPSTEIGGSEGTRQRASADAYAALLDAIQWHVTGEERYAIHAVKLLSAWGNTVKTADAQLFQFPARTMSIAAEMLRHEDGTFYEGWAEADLANFKEMVRSVLVPACRSQALNNPMTSWSAPAATGILAAGIFLDDEELYEEGLGYFRSKEISGSVYNSIAEDGQVKEMGRDNVHAMLTLNDLAQMAQLAWSQGDDLWGEDNNRLLRGFEYFCTYNLGYEDLHYTPWTADDGSTTWFYISMHNNGFRLRPDGRCYECVYHHYKELKHVDTDTEAPHLTAFTRLARPENESESLGFGTLLFTIDGETSPMMTEVPGAAENLTAEASQGFAWLKWTDSHREDASGFRVMRSTDGVNYLTLENMDFYARKSYMDTHVEPGQTYYYKVVLHNLAGEAAESEVAKVRVPVCAGLPDGWRIANIGNGWTTGTFTSSMSNSFVVEGGGDGFRRTDEGHAFVCRPLRGNGTFTVRMLPTPQNYNSIGIMLRSALASGSMQMGVTLGGTGLRYSYAVSRQQTGGQTQWKCGDDFTHTPVWFRLVREGNSVSAFQSRDGEQWHLIQTLSMSLPSVVYVGMVVAAGETYRAEFDHVSLTTEETQSGSTKPARLTATCAANNTVRLVWNGVFGAEAYKVYCDGVMVAETPTNSHDDAGVGEGRHTYEVSAVVNGVECEKSIAVEVEVVRIEELRGTVIGTAGSWGGNASATRDAVFDGNLETFFDATSGNGAWAGMDLGSGKEAQVTEIRYCPRQSHPDRMVGGCFQGANSSTFSDAFTFHTVSETPATGTFTIVPIDNAERYRYLRYLSPDGGYCNVSEVKFFGMYHESGTGITQTETTNKGNNPVCHDLQGRLVNPTMLHRGVYICDGKKYLAE
ncbi:MAG: alginate lyase family protein [Alloprevotella sp.]